MAQPVGSLYVHVPFCVGKCMYCAFYSEPASDAIVDRYVDALVREFELVAHELKPETVYFGGGTPTVLDARQWQWLFNQMNRLRVLDAVTEWTVECNPATVSLAKAHLLRSFGVTRVSLGVQSLNDELLVRLGRVHSRRQVFRAFDTLRNAGFDNINIDLMFAIPGQTMEMWRQTLAETSAMQPEHLSCYEITYEDDTPLFRLMGARRSDADEELACAMYEELVEHAAAAGYRQYEVSNFARDFRQQPGHSVCTETAMPDCSVAYTPSDAASVPAFACRHNINYWRGGQFYGLGPSAASYVAGVHMKNFSDTKRYCALLEQGQRPIELREQISPLKHAGEVAAFGLRMVSGWSFDEFKRVTGFDLLVEWRNEIEQLVERGWGTRTDTGVKLTRQGLRFADAVAEMFLR